MVVSQFLSCECDGVLSYSQISILQCYCLSSVKIHKCQFSSAHSCRLHITHTHTHMHACTHTQNVYYTCTCIHMDIHTRTCRLHTHAHTYSGCNSFRNCPGSSGVRFYQGGTCVLPPPPPSFPFPFPK